MTELLITLPGALRTKKTGQLLLTKPFPRLIPGEPYREWFKNIMTYGPLIREQARKAGVELPIKTPVQVFALIYRDALRGDLIGYLESVADALQQPAWSKPVPGKKVKQIRDGLGVIVDDNLICSWDGSRLMLDRAAPRVELVITPMAGLPVQDALFESEPEKELEEVF